MLGFAIIFIIVGLVHIFLPEVIWYLEHGIHDKNAEPGEYSELIYRILGGIAVIVGIAVAVSEVTK
ncbi:MAG: hypothetical protein IJC04_00135 [Oscillospiraceae bacterium]|nr:hypothetical protein [Oscillospiraceae bacterium]